MTRTRAHEYSRDGQLDELVEHLKSNLNDIYEQDSVIIISLLSLLLLICILLLLLLLLSSLSSLS